MKVMYLWVLALIFNAGYFIFFEEDNQKTLGLGVSFAFMLFFYLSWICELLEKIKDRVTEGLHNDN